MLKIKNKGKLIAKIISDIQSMKLMYHERNLMLCAHPEVINVIREHGSSYAVSVEKCGVITYFEGLELIRNDRIYPYFVQYNLPF